MLASLILLSFLLPSLLSYGMAGESHKATNLFSSSLPYDPPNVTIVVDIIRARTMTLDDSEPRIYFKVYIDGEDAVQQSDIYKGKDVWIDKPIAKKEVPYDAEGKVNIQIQMWEKKPLMDRILDISKEKSLFHAGKTINLTYYLKRGNWTGDDFLGDENGYGHCSGFEDGNENENDCEIWFDIYEQGEGWGGDHLTYWEKVNVYHLDPLKNYSGADFNGDGIPIEWEDKYGFDPFSDKNLSEEDPDDDGLSNFEEYETSQWLSDPFSRDIFLEVDGMEGKYSWSKPYIFPKEAQYILCNAFARHNITLHVDDGGMGGGGELIPYREIMTGHGLGDTRTKYFLHWDHHNWRLGVFHYAIICSQIQFSRPAGGCAFDVDSFSIGGQYVRNWAWSFYLQGSNYYRAFASVVMHELGHTLGLNNFRGIDNENTRFPWKKEYWEWGNYRSCMNYRYVYKVVDYSDGDDADHDQNDWEVINLARINWAT